MTCLMMREIWREQMKIEIAEPGRMTQSGSSLLTWILGNVTRIPRHELPQTLDFSDFLPLFT